MFPVNGNRLSDLCRSFTHLFAWPGREKRWKQTPLPSSPVLGESTWFLTIKNSVSCSFFVDALYQTEESAFPFRWHPSWNGRSTVSDAASPSAKMPVSFLSVNCTEFWLPTGLSSGEPLPTSRPTVTPETPAAPSSLLSCAQFHFSGCL